MSYAVIQSGGKQYKVKSGEILKIEKLPNSKSDTKIEFNDILAYGDNILSPYANISLNSILVSDFEFGNFSIFKISPDFTLYCFPPDCITAYDINRFFYHAI